MAERRQHCWRGLEQIDFMGNKDRHEVVLIFLLAVGILVLWWRLPSGI